MENSLTADINPRNYYRLPWSLADNGISWLEVTSACNLACEGCYRENVKDSHKTIPEIDGELAVFKKYRKSDCMSIAGGDPLVHPEIVEIVRHIRQGGWKPILNTNGLALTPEFLKDLKKAGVFGFTFHIDTSQKRRDSHATVESEHNALRLKFAEMLAKEGGIDCSFNQTVSTDTLPQIPDQIRWAKQYPDIVNTMVFILFRAPGLLRQRPKGGPVRQLSRDLLGRQPQPQGPGRHPEDPRSRPRVQTRRLPQRHGGIQQHEMDRGRACGQP
jgi:uncharacterized radical SAM superfamily Fe-S cluster-containing enzyme